MLYTVGLDGDDIELGSRHLRSGTRCSTQKGDDPAAFEQELLAAQGALGKTGSPPEELADYLASLAGVEASDDRLLRSLPVTPLEVPGNRLYVTQPEETQELIELAVGTTLAASDDVRVQILNGNGVPGIGQEVAELLVGKGYRVILSGNAQRPGSREDPDHHVRRSAEGAGSSEASSGAAGRRRGSGLGPGPRYR